MNKCRLTDSADLQQLAESIGKLGAKVKMAIKKHTLDPTKPSPIQVLKDGLVALGDKYEELEYETIYNHIKNLPADAALKVAQVNYKDLPLDHNFIIDSLKNRVNTAQPAPDSIVQDPLGVHNSRADLGKAPAYADRLLNAYRSSSVAVDLMLGQLGASVFNAVVFDRQNGLPVHTITQLEQNIANYQDFLIKQIKTYLGSLRGLEVDLSTIPDTMYDSSEKYTGVIQALKGIMDQVFTPNNITQEVLNRLTHTYEFNNSSKRQLDAFNAWFILNNFDDLLAQSDLGGVVNIANSYSDFVKRGKYSVGDTTQIITTWLHEGEEIAAEKNIGKKLKLQLQTTPMFTNRVIRPGRYLNVNDVARAFLAIKRAGDSTIQLNPDAIPELRTMFGIYGPTSLSAIIHEMTEDIPSFRKGMQLLVSNMDSIRNLLKDLRWDQSVTDVLYSIWMDNFSTSASHSMWKAYNKKDATTGKFIYNPTDGCHLNDLFQFFASSTPMTLQRYATDYKGNTKSVTLRDEMDDRASYRLQNQIEANLTNLLPRRINNIISRYEGAWNTSEGYYQFTLHKGLTADKNIYVRIRPIKTESQQIVNFVVNGNETADVPAELGSYYFKDVLKLAKDVMGIGFMDFRGPDTAFVRQLLAIKGGDVSGTAFELVSMAGQILSKVGFTRDIISPADTKNDITSKINSYFGQDSDIRVLPNRQINLITQSQTPFLKDLALASNYVGDVHGGQTVKDAEGNTISEATLSQLASKVNEQLNGLRDSVISKFEIMSPHTFRGIQFTREYKGPNNTSKKAIKFSEAEHFLSSFLYDFVAPMSGKGNKIISVLPSVISDKSKIIKAMINLNAMVGNREFFGDITYESLSTDQIKDLAVVSLGQYYLNIFNNVQSNYNKLNEWLKTHSITIGGYTLTNTTTSTDGVYNLNFNIADNFTKFNQLCAQLGLNAKNVFHELLSQYQQSPEGGDITFTDQISHYFYEGQMQFSRNMIGYINRFRDFLNTQDSVHATAFKEIIDNLGIKSGQFGATISSQEFWHTKQGQFISSIGRQGITIDLVNARGEWLTDNPAIAKLASLNGNEGTELWIDAVKGRAILAKVKIGNDMYYITRGQDVLNLPTQTKNGKVINASSTEYDWSGINIQLNPLIDRYNSYDYLFSQEFMNSTVGTHLNHPGKKSVTKSELVEEAARWMAQVKRNVSLTATKNLYAKNLINGIASRARLAVIEDAEDIVFNLVGTVKENGKYQKAKPYDGATFTSGMQWYLENNSLGDAKVGVDKKPLFHFYDGTTGSGGLVKTASFAITNARILDSPGMMAKLNKKMLQGKYKGQDGKAFVVTLDDLYTNFLGNHYELPEIYYRKENGNIVNLEITKMNGDTVAIQRILREDGTQITQNVITNLSFDNNFDLWNFLGGANSVELDADGTFVPAETSWQALVTIANSIGQVQDGSTFLSQKNVYQPLKHSNIDYIVTEGAIKQGLANINPNTSYYDDSYLTSFMIDMNDVGVQLDAEHHADDSELSIMTQVLNALGARGYSTQEAAEVYEALQALSIDAIQQYTGELKSIFKTGDADTDLRNAFARTLVKSLKKTTKADGDLLQAVAKNVIAEAADGHIIKFSDDIVGRVPVSDPAVFNKVMSITNSALTKMAVRLKFAGTLSVMNPSNGIYKIFNGKLRHEVKDLIREQDKIAPIAYKAKIRMGHYYKKVGTNEIFFVSDPKKYWELQEAPYQEVLYANVGDVLDGKAVTQFTELGHELGTLEYTFKVGDRIYNIWDLDTVHQMYDIHPSNHSHDLKVKHQQQLAELHNAMNGGVANLTLRVDGRTVKVQATDVEVQPYEVIAGKTYETVFGLNKHDDLSTIRDNRDFFLDRMRKNWASSLSSNTDWDIELKRMNGEHVYLRVRDGRTGRSGEHQEIKTGYHNGELKRIDARGNFSDKIYSDNDEIVKVTDGTKQKEIIVTDANGIKFYLENFDYHTMRISTNYGNHLGSKGLNKFIETLGRVQKKQADRYLNRLKGKNPLLALTNINAEYDQFGDLTQSIDSLTALNDKGMPVNSVVSRLVKDAYDIHTSFLKSLDIIAARIPAQSHQSFMPMRLVGFDNSGLNSAYVSRWQIWLQGSDYDIDKVSLLGFKIGKNGKFRGWSNLFNLATIAHLKASETLPFPTGKEFTNSNVAVISDGAGNVTLPPMDIQVEVEEDDQGKWLNVGRVVFATETPEQIKQVGTFIRQVNELQKRGQKVSINANTLNSLIRNKLNSDELSVFKDDGEERKFVRQDVIEGLVEAINEHNTYVSKGSKDALMNFVVSKMIKISQDPINTVEAQSPIDDPVEVVKKLAENMPSNTQLQSYAPGNVLDKMETLVLTLTGKENTGIAASAMKIFEALTHYYNTVLQTKPNEADKLLFKNIICGQLTSILTDANANGVTQTFPLVQQALAMQDPTIDQMMYISALISLSTDNAKDPTLAKINAGPDLLGLYFAGIMSGISINTLVDTMTSQTGWMINRMLGGNVFNGQEGAKLDAILAQLSGEYKGPRSKILDNAILSIAHQSGNRDVKLSGVWKYFKAWLNDTNFVASLVDKTRPGREQYQVIFDALNGAFNTINNLPMSADKIAEARAYEAFMDFLKDLYIVQNERISNDKAIGTDKTFSPIESIKQLNEINSETANLRINLALNQSLPNKVPDTISYLTKFSEIIESRIDKITKADGWGSAKNVKYINLYTGNEDTMEAIIQAISEKLGGFKLNFHRFVTDEEYRDTAIKAYQMVKKSFNVLDAVWNNPHYVGYMQALDKAIEANKSASIKYRFMMDHAQELLERQGNPRKKLVREKLLQNMQSYFDYKMSNLYLRTTGKYVTIPAGTELTSPNGQIFRTDKDIELRLGTTESNAIFKQWMDEVVFPELSEGIIDGNNSYNRNILLSTIKPVANNSSFKRNPIVAWGLPISTMARSKTEQFKVNEYKDALRDLTKFTKYDNPIANLLYYYNMIVYNGKINQTSFTTLFEELYAGRTFSPLNQYIDFISQLDESGNFSGGDLHFDWNWKELLTYTAPIDNPLTSKLEYIRVKDDATMQYFLLERLPPDNRNMIDPNDDGDQGYDDEQDDHLSIYDYGDVGGDEDVDPDEQQDYGDTGEDEEAPITKPNTPIWEDKDIMARYRMVDNVDRQYLAIAIGNYNLAPEVSNDEQVLRLSGKYELILSLNNDDPLGYQVRVGNQVTTLKDLVGQYNRRVDAHNRTVKDPSQRRQHVLLSDLSLILRPNIDDYGSISSVDDATNTFNRRIDRGHMYSLIEELLKDC